MKTYSVLYAEDVPHYGLGEVEARNDRSAIRKAMKLRTDSFDQYEPDWDRAFCRRIVHIEAPDGTLIAEDLQLDADEAFAIVAHRDKIRIARAAPDLFEALEAQEMAEFDPAAGRRKGYFDRARALRAPALRKARSGC